MKPWLTTDPRVRDILEELRRREPIFHRPELGTTREDFEAMTETEFWEVGASGRRYSREYILGVLDERYRNPGGDADSWKTADFACRQLGPDVYLLTYTLWQGERQTRRATLWRRSDDGWKIVFHQGTVVAQDAPQ